MPIDPNQITAVEKGLQALDAARLDMLQCLALVKMEYKVNEATVKQLPEADQQALILRYKNLKSQAIAILNAMP